MQNEPLINAVIVIVCGGEHEICYWVSKIIIKDCEDIRNADTRHIYDWLLSARTHGAPFLHDVDADGIPKKLTYLNTAAAVNAANKWFSRLNQLQMQSVEGENGTETVMSFESGWRIARLLTVAALRYEGVHMGHCIGGGSYDHLIEDALHQFYSLRDGRNRPHATFEVGKPLMKKGELLQLQGKGNRPPVRKYWPHLRAFIRREQFWLSGNPGWNAGLVQEHGGTYHDICDMPEDIILGGGHDFEGTDITSLPKGLRVMGDLDLRGSEINGLPENLYVAGNLYLNEKIGALPIGLHVHRSVHLEWSKVTELSPDIRLDGDLWLAGTKVASLPKGLRVGGSLYLEGSLITALPEGLHVEGNLSVDGLPIIRLPKKMYVGCNFYARRTGIQDFRPHKGLHIGETLVTKERDDGPQGCRPVLRVSRPAGREVRP